MDKFLIREYIGKFWQVAEVFKNLGEIKTDSDFTDENDPRWEIEQIAYNEFSSGGTVESVQHSDQETIVNRSISRVH